MEQENYTKVKEFIFQGLSQSPELSLVLFLFLFLVSTATVVGNLLIVVTFYHSQCAPLSIITDTFFPVNHF
jgi:hypothetical protein